MPTKERHGLANLCFTGRCYPRDTLIALMKFCQQHQIHLISDEIYALSVFQNASAPDAASFTSVLSLDLNEIIDPRLVHVLWGLSKVSLHERKSRTVVCGERNVS